MKAARRREANITSHQEDLRGTGLKFKIGETHQAIGKTKSGVNITSMGALAIQTNGNSVVDC